MFDTSQIHPLLDSVQSYLGKWLEEHLKECRPADWWERCVMDVLVPEQRVNVLDDGAKSLSRVDLSILLSVFRGNWQSLRRRFHLNPQAYDDAASVKRIRNKYSHRKVGEDYRERFDHDMRTVRFFLKEIGAPVGHAETDGVCKVENEGSGFSVRGSMSYADRIGSLKPIAFDSIVETARESLPENIRRAPWIGLEHGVVPLDSEQKLDQYLAAYGKLHLEKIRMAFDALENPVDDLKETVSVVDWGCGQALATCAFLDWFRANDVDMSIVRNTYLVDTSKMAIDRACANVCEYKKQYGLEMDVNVVNKRINDVSGGDFKATGSKTTVFLLSNILDVESVDIEFLAEFIKHNFTGRQIFFCASPLNQGASRIEAFAQKFGISAENILTSCRGRLKGSQGTVSMLTFVIDEGMVCVRRTDVSPKSIKADENMELQRVLRRHRPKSDVLDRVVQFYQMAIELERAKEPEVKRPVPFVFTAEGDVINVSFEENLSGSDVDGRPTPFAARCKEFLEKCKSNADKKTRWPKDLYLALNVRLGERDYPLLSLLKPFDELDGFDFERDAMSVRLHDFSVCIGSVEPLQLTDEKVNVLGDFLHSDGITLEGLGEKICEIVGSDAVLDRRQVSVALCDKAVSLAQISSELRKLEGGVVKCNPLLKAFLENSEYENSIDSVPQEGLISIVPMDEGQRAAVAHALNNRVSVVVGPPGCGKTQLLLNLLANALVHGKKVIVASKNNKAVDNVKDRFRAFDPQGCFLRFGNKKCLVEETVPKIAELLNLAQCKGYDDAAYAEAIRKVREAIDCIKNRSKLEDERRALQASVADVETEIEEANQELSDARRAEESVLADFLEEARQGLESKRLAACRKIEEAESEIVRADEEIVDLCKARDLRLESFWKSKADIVALDNLAADEIEGIASRLQQLRMEIEYETSGVGGLAVRIFGKKRIAKKALDVVSTFPQQVRRYLRGIDSREELSEFHGCRDVLSFCAELQRGVEAVVACRQEACRIQEESNTRVVQCESRKESARKTIESASSIRKQAEDVLAIDDALSEYAQQTYRVQIVERRGKIEAQINDLRGFVDRKAESRKRDLVRLSEITDEIQRGLDLVAIISDRDFGETFVALALNHYLHAEDSARGIGGYKQYLPDSIPWQKEYMPKFVCAAQRFIDVFRVVAVTSLSVKSSFPMAEGLFDILVIDEASQCDVASALPLILRAKQIVVIGDPKQLRHISHVKVGEELAIKRHLGLSGAVHLKYVESSLWDYARYWLPWCGDDRPCVLENHYRCHPDIIGYSNEMFYGDLAVGGLRVCTSYDVGRKLPQGIIWKDVQGRQKSDGVNVNEEEARFAVEIAYKCAKSSNEATIGIVTHFKDQAKIINEMIPADLRDRIVVDTVHKFQGDEKDVMVYSPVVTTNSPEKKIRWIDLSQPNLVNVAVTRARRLLIVVGDRKYIKHHSKPTLPLGHLVEYVEILEARKKANNQK